MTSTNGSRPPVRCDCIPALHASRSLANVLKEDVFLAPTGEDADFGSSEAPDWQLYASILKPYELFSGPNAITRHDADHLPDPVNPFFPQEGESLVPYPLGHMPVRDDFASDNPELGTIRLGYDALGRSVVIKAVKSDSSELRIARYLQAQRRHNPNWLDHTLPVLDSISAGYWTFLVMPEWDSFVMPYNVGEYIDWLKQLLEGLAYLHDHGIAHRVSSVYELMTVRAVSTFSLQGLSSGSIQLSVGQGLSLVGKPFLSTFVSRFAFIDFGLSTQFTPEARTKRRLVLGSSGTPGYKAPELSDTVPFDPFCADVYSLAYCIMNHMHEYKDTSPVPELVHHVCREFTRLLADMTLECPECRPTAAEALSRLDNLIRNTPEGVLRSPGCDWKWGGESLGLFRARVARHRQDIVVPDL